MINVDKLGAYYFPLDKKPRGQFLTLELYSELSLSSIIFDEVGGEVVGDYFLTSINSGMTEQISNGEYNYTLYDKIDGEKISIGLIRFDLEEGGQTDDEEYVVYQDDFDGYVQAIELTTTAFTENGVYEAQDKGWYEVTVNIDTDWYYTSGYTDGFDTGYQSGNTDGVNATLDWFYFRSRQDGSQVRMTSNTTAITVELEYSFDKLHWTEWDFSAITVDSGDTVYFRGNNERFGYNSNHGYGFRTNNARFDIGGDIRSLLDKTITITSVPEYNWCLAGLFEQCEIVNVDPRLLCGFTTLYDGCFYCMFMYCNTLINTPELPWTELKNGCYGRMFYKTAITTAPELPAQITKDNCYWEMFKDCTSLTYIKCLASGTLKLGRDFTQNVPSGGTFVRDINADWSTVRNGIPEGWTVLVDNVPESALS